MQPIRGQYAGCGSVPCVRAAAEHLLVCMCVSVRVCASECEQVHIIFNFLRIFELSSGSKWWQRRVRHLSEPPEEKKKTFHDNVDSCQLEKNKFAAYTL